MILIVGGAYQGKTAYVQEHFPKYRLVNRYQEEVRRQLKEGLDPLEEVKKLPLEEKLAVICDEVGSGLVPVDAFEREYREAVGRVGGWLAGEAEQVIRVICGIGTVIKG